MWNTKGIDSIDAAVTQCQDTHNANNEMGKKVLCTRDDETHREVVGGARAKKMQAEYTSIDKSISECTLSECAFEYWANCMDRNACKSTHTHTHTYTHSIENKRNKSDAVSFVLCLFLQLCFCFAFASLSFGFGYRFMCVIVLCSRFKKQNTCTSLLCLPSFGPFFRRCSLLLLLLLCFNDFQWNIVMHSDTFAFVYSVQLFALLSALYFVLYRIWMCVVCFFLFYFCVLFSLFHCRCQICTIPKCIASQIQSSLSTSLVFIHMVALITRIGNP